MYDFYKILDLPRDASNEDIKRAYRNKAKEVHPDVNNSPKANEVFAVVNEAYETLSDDKKRYLHDMKLNYADTARAKAERKKQYYGSSVKNDSYTNPSSFHYDWNTFKKGNPIEKDDYYYFRQSPIIYNLLFVSGMFLGFVIVIVTIVGTFNNYWPKPFILISILGFILIYQGWKGIVGKKTLLHNILRKFRR